MPLRYGKTSLKIPLHIWTTATTLGRPRNVGSPSKLVYEQPSKTIALTATKLLKSAADVGYGTYVHLRRTLKNPNSRRAAIALRRMAAGRPALLKHALQRYQGDRLGCACAWPYLEQSEKGVVSFLLGITMADVALNCHLGSAPARLYHYRLYTNPALVKASKLLSPGVHPKGSGKVPDFIAKDSSGNWLVVEAKGKSGKGDGTIPTWGVVNDGLAQANAIKSIGEGNNRPKQVSARYVVVTSIKQSEVEVMLVDPPTEPSDTLPTNGPQSQDDDATLQLREEEKWPRIVGQGDKW